MKDSEKSQASEEKESKTAEGLLARTPDGRPTSLTQLNTSVPPLLQRLGKHYARLNAVLAGMYTGVGCAGTPHSHHSYSEESPKDTNSKKTS